MCSREYLWSGKMIRHENFFARYGFSDFNFDGAKPSIPSKLMVWLPLLQQVQLISIQSRANPWLHILHVQALSKDGILASNFLTIISMIRVHQLKC